MADLTITAANVLNTSASVATAPAGESITAGQSIYISANDGKAYKAQADGTAAQADVAGLALNGAGAGQPVQYATDGAINIGATTAKGTVYCVSATAGGICPIADLASGDFVSLVGYATATDGSLVVRRKATGVEI